jgi:chromosome segregation ATPase
MIDRAVELAVEKERLEADIAAKAHDPYARLAEIQSELERRHAEQERQRAEREDKIKILLSAYEPARDRADELTVELAKALEAAAKARAELKSLHAAPESVSVRAARRDPTDLSLAPIGEARLRLRRALTREY